MPGRFTVPDLYDAVDYADQRMVPLRQRRTEAIREYGGRYWYEDDRVRRPLNLIQRGVKVLVAHLAGRNPKFEAKTERLMFRGHARKLSKQLEMRAEKAGMVMFSRMCLADAFFGGKAVVRVSEKSTSEGIRNGDRFVYRGELARRLVSMDDWIFDPAARNDAEAAFEGERYRIGRDKALEGCGSVWGYTQEMQALLEAWRANPDALDEAAQKTGEELDLLDALGFLENVATPEECETALRAASALSDGRYDYENRADRADDLTSSDISDDQRYGLIDTIELLDVAIYWDAETCILVTLVAQKGEVPKYLRAEIWDGPSRGPYEHLEFDPLPDNPHGPSVVSSMREQSEIANSVIGKMVAQIEKTRRVLVYKKQRAADALRITKTHDGGSVGIEGEVNDIKDVDLGGVSPELAPFAQLVIGYWNMMGSFDVLGGTPGGGERTATEDSRLGMAAGVMVESLSDLFDDFQNRIAQHEAWYLCQDPFIVAPMTMRIPGSAMIEVVYDSSKRMGSFADYTFKIRPRSMQRIDPNVRSQRVIELINAVILAAQAALATGGLIDPAAVARILGHEFEMDELDEVLRDPLLQAELADLYMNAPGPAQGLPAAGGMGGGVGPAGPLQIQFGGMGGPQQPGKPRLASGMAQRQSVMQSARAPMRRAV